MFIRHRRRNVNTSDRFNSKRLDDSYVFPETAKKMEQSIRERVETRLSNPDFKAGVEDEIQKLEKELAAFKAKS